MTGNEYHNNNDKHNPRINIKKNKMNKNIIRIIYKITDINTRYKESIISGMKTLKKRMVEIN